MNPSAAAISVDAPGPTVGFSVREVYKAGWVRRSAFSDKKGGPFGKRYDRLWAIFCVHDDIQPFLEFYNDPKSSSSHQPLWAISLVQCLHISPSIVIQGDAFEFVVTLTSTVLRLCTATREHMNEWVEVLRNRLRDIGILEPKDNLYSRLPETKSNVPSSTRDPTSPLPLPPSNPVLNGETDQEQNPISNEADSLYSDTDLNLISFETPVAITPTEEIENSMRLEIPGHVTVISVNNDIDSDPFEETTTDQRPINAFCTRVRIASAPSTVQDFGDRQEENNYEAIFMASEFSRDHTIRNGSGSLTAGIHCSNGPHQMEPTSSLPIDTDVVFRHPSHTPRREGLRRTVSVGPELPNPGSQNRDVLLSSMPTINQRPVALLLPPPPPRDRRRDGVLRNPVLLPRPAAIPPPIFVAAPPPPIVPLAARLSTPSFRPTANSSALQPVITNHGNGEIALSLKERQVTRLRMEMQHPAGVRVVLKKKDCINTIAFLDGFGSVWVGGWRQKEKPLLYNVFHIGDQIVRVGHNTVSSAAEVQKVIKADPSNQIEFIVRRMPFGRVFHLRRESEGQNVGIITEGSTAEIGEVVHGGIAALQGVPALAVSPVTSLPCTWTLTEINGRPLNLFSKEAEARDRLNAVGKAITILVQPTDFVKLLKKQLKALRGYKEYLLG